MRAAIYARVSTEEQLAGYSIDAQLRACRNFAQEKGWVIAGEYVDEGRSARTDDIGKRPRFKAMIDDALAGRVDTIVVHKLDRFSRNLRLTLECFDKFSRAGVGFSSVSEQIDYSIPMGRVFVAMAGAFAQFYSDNLGQEVRKGKMERREQGLYLGLLPFGAMKGEDGLPVPDTRELPIDDGEGSVTVASNYAGLILAFEESAKGASDAEVARLLNVRGYRTTGNRGPSPFTKDTVRGIVPNRFYLGELPDGHCGWVKGKHEPFVIEELWQQAQEARERNRKARLHVPKGRSATSLTGIAYCLHCGGKLTVRETVRGRRRIECYNRSRGRDCPQKSVFLDVYEAQIETYLESLHIPEDYQAKILEAHRKLQAAFDDAPQQRAKLEGRVERIKDLYGWGDMPKEDYLAEKEALQRELKLLAPPEEEGKELERLAYFLGNVAAAWKEASQAQRNRLVRQLVEEIWVKDKQVVAVIPRPELQPFFALQYEPSEELSRLIGNWRPRRDSNPRSPP